MSVFAAASGVGSWPGVSARVAAEVVVGELPDLTHLVELPARGVGADLIGRAGALLVDIGIDTVARGYRISAGRGAVTRRAISLLDEDVDALEEAWEKAGLTGGDRVVKIQAPGPITLAAGLELGGGHRALTDAGAVRDLAGSLAEGVAVHRDAVARRLGATVVVQFDEPSLPAALAGRLPGVSALSPVHPVDEAVAGHLFADVVGRVGGPVALHSCAAALPWDLLLRSPFEAVGVDLDTVTDAGLDGLGALLDAGRTVCLGVVPAVAPPRPPRVEDLAARVAAVTDRLGFGRSVLAGRVGVTPACGLAGASQAWARTAVELTRRTRDALSGDVRAD